MQAKRVLSGLLISSALLLVGCSEETSKNTLTQIKDSEVDKMMNGKKDGILLVVKETDGEFESYVNKIKNISEEKNKSVKMYNTFQPDGKELVDRDTFEYTSELKGERLYFIKDGEVQDELNINVLTGTQLNDEVENFIDQNS